MVATPKTTVPAAKKKQPAAVSTSQSIEEQTQAFLRAGGKIQHVESGVSGKPSLAGPKHIVLGKSLTK